MPGIFNTIRQRLLKENRQGMQSADVLTVNGSFAALVQSKSVGGWH